MAVAVPVSDIPTIGALHHLKLLFWLKAKLTMRGLQRSRSAVLGMVLALLVLLPFSLSIATGAGIAFWKTGPFIAGQILRGTLLVIYLIWLIAPLLGFALNDSYDITRLFVYPVSLRRLFVGTILGALLDITTLLLLPTLLAALIGFGRHGLFAFLVAALVLSLFLFHTLALSQAVLLATAGILRSRKFRDIALVLVPLFWMTYYIGSQTFFRNLRYVDWKHVFTSPAWQTVNLLPPGFAARAMADAAAGRMAPALGWTLGLAALTTATVYIAGWLVKKAYEGDEIGLSAPRTPQSTETVPVVAPAAASGDNALLARLNLPPVVAAIVDKEIKYYAREPYFRLVLMNFVYMLFVGVFMTLSGPWRQHGRGAVMGGGGFAITGTAVWVATGLLLFQQTTLFYNIFGPEGGAASVLFGFPSSRRQIIIGKNLPLFVALAFINVTVAIILCALARTPDLMLVIVPWVILALGTLVAVGNLVSVYLPYRVAMKSFRMRQQQTGQGFAFTFLYLGVTLASSLLLVPVLAALLVPFLFFDRTWLFLTIPLSAFYVAFLYWLSLRIAEPLLLAREPEVMEKVYRAPE